MNLAEKYLDGLKNACELIEDDTIKKDYEDFKKLSQGATDSDIEKLLKLYPDTPKTLIDLLKIVDGTYFREYSGGTLSFYILGSDLEEYPYYLLSVKQIIENKNEAFDLYEEMLDDEDDELASIDEKIIRNSKNMNWLHFSDCSNNGGTSTLFIDFSPSEKGTYGQVIMFVHDPDEFEVIADSFDDYLEQIILREYDFLNYYDDDDYDDDDDD